LITFVLFTLGAIGSPLWGGSVLAATDEMSLRSPYYESGMGGLRVQNTYMDDTYDAVIPDTLLFSQELRNGDIAAWNPYVLGGVPLAATPTLAVLNPLTLPYYVLPAPLAPGYVKLLEMAFSAAMTFLFLRRLRLGRPAALLGGLLFSSSAFMIVWTNWPHTRTAAFIPAVFWALERLIQQRRARDAALVVLAVGGMLAGGFPAVTAFTLYTAAPYVLVRAIAEYPGQWRRILAVVAGAAAGVAGAVALLAVQLAPFVVNLAQAQTGARGEAAKITLDRSSLVTTVAPWAEGGVGQPGIPMWYLSRNMVESLFYVGAVGVVLLIVALAQPWSARAFLPRGVWSFMVGALGAWLAIIFLAPVGALVGHLPVFSTNLTSRGRSVVGLLVVTLAAVGLEILLRWRRTAMPAYPTAGARQRRRRTAYATAVCLGFVGAGLLVVWEAQRAAHWTSNSTFRHARVDNLNDELLKGGAFLAVAMGAVAAIWWSTRHPRPLWRRVRLAAAAGLPVLAAVQALTLIGPYWPRVDRSTFYPVTATQQYLLDHLGHDRFAGSMQDDMYGMQVGADSKLQLRALDGHAFANRRWAELVNGLPGNPFRLPTYFSAPPTEPIVTSPVLDQLAVRLLVASPRAAVVGTRQAVPADGPATTLRPGVPVTVPLAAGGPLRAVSLTPRGPVPPAPVTAAIEVVLRDRGGQELARSQRLFEGMAANEPFDVPIAAEDVPAGTAVTAEIKMTGLDQPLQVAGTAAGTPALTTVAGGDGKLRLVQAWPAVVYERLTALPRIRWASSAVVDTDPENTIARIASGSVPADQVVLDAAGPPAAGQPADLEILDDGTDEIAVRAAAQGAGYLVVADAIQGQWQATVDGGPASLVPADHGLAAVAVPAGEHTIRLSYTAPYGNAGGWISMFAAAALLAVMVAGPVRDRRRRRAAVSSPRPHANGPDDNADNGS
jgi:hypothetical protein